MKIGRAILSGTMIWVLIFIAFGVMSALPVIKDSELYQNLILYVLLIPFVLVGSKFYYKSGDKTMGLIVGSIMSLVGLILDAIISVPLIIIPHGGSYFSFFINPLLLVTVLLFVVISHFYWKLKVK